MNHKLFHRVVTILMVLVVLTLGVKSATGQEPGPDQSSQPSVVNGIEAAVGSRISYQGVLKEGGVPVTGSRNMVFRLHTNSTCTSQVGSDIVKNGVPVVTGLFSVTLDVLHSSFDGQALWLQVLVEGASLSCREITATPYALSLRPGALISDSLSNPVLKLVNSSAFPGIQSLAGGGTVEDIHRSGFYYAAGEFAGPNGVIGASSDDATDGYGVIGIAQGTSGRGVYGVATADNGTTYGGYFMSESTSGLGVYGVASTASGATYGGYFKSSSTEGRGVYGNASATSGSTYGVYGYHNSTDGGAAGYFHADNNAAASNVAGVYGRVDGDGAALLPVYGVAGHAYFDGVGVGAWSYGGRIFEGRDGDYPSGTLRFYMERNGAAYADVGWNTFITAKDGSEKILYGMQSTEIWVEDYGTATLADGLATVKIAADFAGTVNLSEDYHVFLTPMGDCALYVAEKTAESFIVRAIDGKACNIAFDYRIVAKQIGLENYRMTEIASPAAQSVKPEPIPEDLPVVPPAPEPEQPVDGQSVP